MPLVTSGSGVGNGGDVSLAIASAPNQMAVDSLCAGASSTPGVTPGASQRLLWGQSSGGLRAGGSDIAGASIVTMSWTITTSTGGLGWGIAVAVLRPSSASDAGAPQPDAAPADSAPAFDSAAGTDQAGGGTDGGSGTGPDGGRSEAGAPTTDGGTSTSDGGGGAPMGDGGSTTPGAADGGTATDGGILRRNLEVAIGCACNLAPAPGPGGVFPGVLVVLVIAVARRVRRNERR